MLRKTCILLCALMVTLTHASPQQTLQQLIDDEWQLRMRNNPLFATSNGVHDYNHLLPDVSDVQQQKYREQQAALLTRANAIEQDKLSQNEQINLGLLKWILEDRITGIDNGHSRINMNTFTDFTSSAVRGIEQMPLKSVQDFDNYLARMRALPTYFKQHTAWLQKGLDTGLTQPKIVMQGIAPVIARQVYDNPTESRLYSTAEKYITNLPESQRNRYLQQVKQAIEQHVTPAFAALRDFLQQQYIPNTRESVGIVDAPGGKDYYASQIKWYVTTTDYSAEQIHQIGLTEVARIKAEMLDLMKEVEFTGSFTEFQQFLRSDPQFYAKTAKELLMHATFIANRIDAELPRFFGKLPRLPYSIQPVPDSIAPNYTTAAYWPAPIGGDSAGTYVLNTYQLDQRPLYELTALTLHESVPGHHFQNALSQELEGVAPFRRKLYLSAFGEGWGLYTEKLGVEMGVYDSPYEHFGRLSYEMWRACRLVIDTGIHAMGWTRQQGLDYLSDNSMLSLANVRAEVDRYISWPGQALSYKMGEIKIWELRNRAEKALGEQFDIKAFHDLVLSNGAVTLHMLDDSVNRYIREATKD